MSCCPKAIQALQHPAGEYGIRLTIVDSVEKANRTQKQRLLEKVRGRFGEQLDGRHCAVWGLAFKPNTDDMREAPSLSIIQALQDAGARIRAFDPLAMTAARTILDDVTFGADPYDTAAGAAALVIVTERNEVRATVYVDIQRNNDHALHR